MNSLDQLKEHLERLKLARSLVFPHWSDTKSGTTENRAWALVRALIRDETARTEHDIFMLENEANNAKAD